MRRRDLESEMKRLGWWFLRHGGRHDVWTNGSDQEYVPRHNEINEFTAQKILRNVREKPCKS